MPNESKIYFNNLIKDATATASTEATGHAKEYLTDEILKTTWRSTVITSTTISLDFAAATPIAGVTLHYHNVVAGDTTYVVEADAAGTYSPADESENLALVTRTVKEKNTNGTLTDVTRSDAHYVDDWNYRYYRLRIVKASGTYIEAGQLAIWKDVYTFPKNFNVGYTAGQENRFSSSTGTAGQEFRKQKFSRFFVSMPFKNITDAQKDKLVEAGQSDYIAYYHGMTSKLYWGILTVNPPVNVRTIDESAPAELWNVTATFTESL